MNNYVLIWGESRDRLSCDPLRESHDSRSPHIRKKLVPHLVASLNYLSQIYSYYIRGDMSPLRLKSRYLTFLHHVHRMKETQLAICTVANNVMKQYSISF